MWRLLRPSLRCRLFRQLASGRVAHAFTLRLFLFCMVRLPRDRIALLGDAVKTLGWPTLAGFARVGHSFGLRYAERFETPLRPRRSAFYYLLLLPPAALSGNGSREESVPESTAAGPKHLSVPADWVCDHAGTRASADQRAEEKQCVASAAGIEAARIASDARKEEARFERAAFIKVRRCHERGPAILATPILRLQCVERCEEERKTALHSRESSDGAAGEASEGVAVEQLFVLCER